MQKLKGLSVSLGGRRRSRECWIMELTSKTHGFVLQLKAAGPRRDKDDTVCFLVWHFYELTST